MKNKKYLKPTLMVIVGISLFGCNGDETKSSYTQNVTEQLSAYSAKELVAKICNLGIASFAITEADSQTYQSVFHLGSSRGLRAYVTCKNPVGEGSKIDVTNDANWSSANKDIFAVNNTDAKGYVEPKKIGNSTMNVTYDGGKYSSALKVNVSAAELTGVTLSLARDSNQLAKGETVGIHVEANYKDGSHDSINPNDFLIEAADKSAIDAHSDSITARKEGATSITVSYKDFEDTIRVEVLPAEIKALVIDDSNLKNFTTYSPTTVTAKAKLLLTDDTLIDVPNSSILDPTVSVCSLFRNPDDQKIPFLNKDGHCDISSTTESGENKLSYSYAHLDSKGAIDNSKPIFESSIIIRSSNANIKNIAVKLDPVFESSSLMMVGKVYRYHVYANLNDGTSVDVTKNAQLTLSAKHDTIDVTNRFATAPNGYTGGEANPVDDGKGGVIKLVDYIDKNSPNSTPDVVVTLNAKLGNVDGEPFGFTKTTRSPIVGIKELSSFFVDNIYNSSDVDLKNKITSGSYAINGVDGNSGEAIPNNYNALFRSFKVNQLQGTYIPDNYTFPTATKSDSYYADTDVTIPRIMFDEPYRLSSGDIAAIATIGCNDSNLNQTITTQNVSQSYAVADTFSRGFSVGTEISREMTLFGNKSSFKVSAGYNQSWSWTNTKTTTYTLPSQGVMTPPHGKVLVIQKLYKSTVGVDGVYNVPLTDNSCIPFMMNGTIPDALSVQFPVCTPYNSLPTGVFDSYPTYKDLFKGNNTLKLHANIQTNEAMNTNTVSIYIYLPSDPGYNTLSCGAKFTNAAYDSNSNIILDNDVKVNPAATQFLKQVTYQQ